MRLCQTLVSVAELSAKHESHVYQEPKPKTDPKRAAEMLSVDRTGSIQ